MGRIPKEAPTMNGHHNVDQIKIEHGVLSLIIDGRVISKALIEISPSLAKANDTEIGTFEVSPSGYGIHWPLIDEDISIDGLLGVTHTPAQRKKSA
jgi:hypothetical protein